MKKIIVITMLGLFLAFGLSVLTGQNVNAKAKVVQINKKNFPDKYVRNTIASEFDINDDQKLSQKEIIKAKKLTLWAGSTKMSLKGLRCLTHLKKLRIYRSSYVVDTSEIGRIRNLESLEWDNAVEKMIKISITGLHKLKKLKYLTLEAVNIDNPKVFAKMNSLLEIKWDCWDDIANNSPEKKTKRGSSSLKYFCNMKKLKKLIVKNVKIKDISYLKKLKNLEMLKLENNSIDKIDISKNKNLVGILVIKNPISKCDYSKNKKLLNYYMEETNFGDVVFDNTQFKIISMIDNKYQTKVVINNNSLLEGTGIWGKKLKTVSVQNNPNINHLALNIRGSRPTYEFTTLDKVEGAYIQMEHGDFDFSLVPNVKEAWINYGVCDKLDLSHNTKLSKLDCWSTLNQEAIDLNNNTELTHLSLIIKGNLDTLDMRNLSKLTDMVISGGALKHLILGNHPVLERINVTDNQLQDTFDLSQVPNLLYLHCNNNQLTSIDAHLCKRLFFLDCINNKLTRINIMGTRINEFSSYGNPGVSIFYEYTPEHFGYDKSSILCDMYQSSEV